jgi:hypothetical protein
VTILSTGDGATVSGTVTVNVSAEDDVKVAKITLDIDGGQVALSYGSTLSYGWKVPRGKGKGKGNSSSSITARAWDADGNVAAASITVSH